MTVHPDHLRHARQVADAILYEGYLLYPYRRSACKNQLRFQFGVLMPPAYAEVDPSEPSASQTECLVECADDAQVDIQVRFLQLQRRVTTAADSWDEARERDIRVRVPVASLLENATETVRVIEPGQQARDAAGDQHSEPGQVIREWASLTAVVRVHGERVAGPYGALRLRVHVANGTMPPGPVRTRPDGLRHALIAAHVLIGVPAGRFISMTDPPEWAAAQVAACANVGTWPVLAGPPECRNLMLSSPVILPDHPEVAPESAGELFDATEIDEILTLRTLAMTDAEKQEARDTDPLAAELLDRLDGLPPEMIERMHGAIRYLAPARSRAGTGGPGPGEAGGPGETGLPGGHERVPWWDPGADTSVSPGTDHIMIAGCRVARGSRVIMRPGSRRADAQDLFLSGREALVEAVVHDVDGQVHVAVSPAGDPVAALQSAHGRFLYFAPEEIEPLPAGGRAGDSSPAVAHSPPDRGSRYPDSGTQEEST